MEKDGRQYQCSDEDLDLPMDDLMVSSYGTINALTMREDTIRWMVPLVLSGTVNSGSVGALWELQSTDFH